MSISNEKLFNEKFDKSADLISANVLNEIKNFIKESGNVWLVHINPYKFAKDRSLDKLEVLKAFLHMTKNGVFNLYWSIHCPSCKGISQYSEKLVTLKHDSKCEFCKVDYEAGFDKNIEVSFCINPNIVDIKNVDNIEVLFSTFEREPGISISLEKGETHYLQIELKEGNYFLINPEEKKAVNFAVMNSKPGTKMKYELDYDSGRPLLEIVKMKEGKADINIKNQTESVKDFIFARIVAQDWPSASVISSLQEFRDFFSSEMLSLDESFSIQSLSFVFTDIKGSTELYERLGDSNAFRLVKEHFYIMEEVVKKHNGGIVKTIGDAIMAVFVNPSDAVKSAFEMIDRFDEFNIKNKSKDSIIIKVGIHSGPCIAVTMNDRIDYFGTTVNIAARVQGLSDGRDIFISDSIYSESNAAKLLAEFKWNSESLVTSLKGLKSNYKIHKLTKISG